MIRMIIVEDQKILLDSLADSFSLIDDIKIVAKCPLASEIVELCAFYKPDLVLMDICNQDGHAGINETLRLKRKFPEIKVILMTAMLDVAFVEEAKAAGADGFVYKNSSKEEFLATIRQTMQDYPSFPSETVQSSFPEEFDLTEREMDIIRLVCVGKNRKEISETLFLSENTIRNNINRILMKTNYDSIAQLAIFAVSKGYIVPDGGEG